MDMQELDCWDMHADLLCMHRLSLMAKPGMHVRGLKGNQKRRLDRRLLTAAVISSVEVSAVQCDLRGKNVLQVTTFKMSLIVLQAFQNQKRQRSELVSAGTRHVLSWHAAAAVEYEAAQ